MRGLAPQELLQVVTELKRAGHESASEPYIADAGFVARHGLHGSHRKIERRLGALCRTPFQAYITHVRAQQRSGVGLRSQPMESSMDPKHPVLECLAAFAAVFVAGVALGAYLVIRS